MANTKRKWIWGCAAAALVVIIILAALAFCGSEPTEDEQPADIAVKTSVCTLYYPAEWKDQVAWEVREGETVTVSFSGDISDQVYLALFDVIFSQSPEGSLGALEAGGKTWHVRVETFEAEPAAVDTKEKEFLFNAMQEDLNYLIAKIPMKSSQPSESVLLVPAETEPAPDLTVETPYGILTCPGVPGRQLSARTAQDGDLYTVTYFWDRAEGYSIRLFEIGFGGEDIYASGFLADSGVPVRLTIFPLEANLSPADQDAALQLQELLNSILEGLPLMQRENIAQTEPAEETVPETESTETTAPATEGTEPPAAEPAPPGQYPADFAADTPYGILCFPEEQQENLKTEVRDENGCTVRFLYVRDNGQSCPLFDVVFGGTGDFQVGTLTRADGREVKVSMVSHEPAFDGSWTQDDRTKFYTMAEGANYLFDRFAELYDFAFLK